MIKKIVTIVLVIGILLTSNIITFATEKESKEYESINNKTTHSQYTDAADFQKISPENHEETIKPNIMTKTYQGSKIEVTESPRKSDTQEFANNENTDPNYAYLVENDYVVQGAIEVENEERWYAFVLEEKSKITLLMQMVENLDADLYLFELIGSQLVSIGGSANEGSVEEYCAGVLNPGVYYFAVSGYSGVGNFAFAYYQSSIDANYE